MELKKMNFNPRWIWILFFFEASLTADTHIKDIYFHASDLNAEVTVDADAPLKFTKTQNFLDNNVLLELSDSILDETSHQKIDASSFEANVQSIEAKQMDAKTVQVIVKLKLPVLAEVFAQGNQLILKVPKKIVKEGVLDRSVASAPLKEHSSPLDDFVKMQSTKKFSGKPITLQVRDAEVTDVLRLIGEASGFNMMIGSDVEGKITLSLVDVPWDQALDVIMDSMKLGADRKESVLRVMTLKNLLLEKQEQKMASDAVKASSPRVTRIFSISYADLSDLSRIVSSFVVAANADKSRPAGVVQADARTNSLIVQDHAENLEKVKKLIEILDTQTPQVLIESKVVEATEGFSKNIGGSLGYSTQSAGTARFLGSFSGGNPVDPLLGSPGVFSGGSAVSSAGGSTMAFAPTLGFIPGASQLNAILSFAETESEAKVLAAPKTVVLNKQTASIISGTPVQVPGTTFVAGVGSVPTSTVQQANISLNVTPTVTNDGSVQLKLVLSKDVIVPFSGTSSGIGNRMMNTLVLVESGSTLVIGGIYGTDSSKSSSGFPILRDIPILGSLFGNRTDILTRSELFFFVTPRVLNLKEAGLGVS
jgi:type IV pilus assembly protein PilQ